MSFDYQNIIDSYLRWIKDNSSIKIIKDKDICEVTTPFMDRHNDHVQIYVVKNDDVFTLTDEGETINDLLISGVAIDTPKRKKIFDTMLNGFGVKLNENNALFVESNLSNIGQKKHNLLQAILSINDLYTLSTENIISLFKEEVENYFMTKEVIYSKDIKIAGKTGFDYNIDFLISASKTKPERLIRTLNNPKKDSVLSAIMAFNDIQAIRDKPTENMIIYNDIDNPANSDVINAMKSYQIMNIPWSKKEDYLDRLHMN